MKTINTGLIARIEGHGNVRIEICRNEIKNIHMQVVEGSRFFETLIKGRKWDEVPTILMRICSICTADHNLAAIRGVESAFDVRVSRQTELLRELLMHGSIMESHFLHIYFLALPDLLGYPSALHMRQYYPDVLQLGFRLKKLGNDVQRTIGGRAIHPEKSKVGGFTSLPTETQLAALKRRLVSALRDTENTVDLILTREYGGMKRNDISFSTLIPGSHYDYFGNRILLDDRVYELSRYREVIREVPVSHSTAKRCLSPDGHAIMVGAMARLNLIWDRLPPLAKEHCISSGRFPTRNPMDNTLAQAIECVASIERSIEIVDELLSRGIKNEPRVEVKVKKAQGVGAVEAPRGTLYHEFEFDTRGRVVRCNVITPTTINTHDMEISLIAMVNKMLEDGKSDEEIKQHAEILIRAYDPCLSCSAHVVRVKE